MFFGLATPLLLLLYLAPMACSPSNVPGGGGAATSNTNTQTTQYTPPTPTAIPMGGTILPGCIWGEGICLYYAKSELKPVPGTDFYTLAVRGTLLAQPPTAKTDTMSRLAPIVGAQVRLVLPSGETVTPLNTDVEGCFYFKIANSSTKGGDFQIAFLLNGQTEEVTTGKIPFTLVEQIDIEECPVPPALQGGPPQDQL